MNLEEESSLIKPDEIQNLKVRKRKEEVISHPHIEEKIDSIKFSNLGSTVKISLESGGRFGNPNHLILRDYNAKEINDLVTSREEDLLETLIAILNECVVEPKGFNIGKLTNEEFYEVLIGMKMAFDSPVFDHRWIHECQDNVSDAKDKKLSESQIDLRQAEFKSIEEADNKIKEFFLAKFNELSPEQFSQYLIKKYGQDTQSSISEEVSSVKISEPFLIPGTDKDYEFTFMRIGYLVEGYRLACKEFDGKIRMERNRSQHGIPLEQMKLIREEAIEKLNMSKSRAAIRYSQALCLHGIKVNGESKVLKTTEEKIKEYNNMPKSSMFGYLNAVKSVTYGVSSELELECNLCNQTERRSLQRWVNPFELLPVSNYSGTTSDGKLQHNPVIDFCF